MLAEMLLQVLLQLFLPWEQVRLELRELTSSFLRTNRKVKKCINNPSVFIAQRGYLLGAPDGTDINIICTLKCFLNELVRY